MPVSPTASTALLTDHYELTMVDAALHDGFGERWSVFEVFARSLPSGRRYGVVAGLDRVIDAVERFRFDEDVLAYLDRRGFLRDETLDHLADYRFRGRIDAYREGELYFADSPVLTVHGRFVDAVLLETVILSILNHDSAVASASARMAQAAQGRPLMEFGGRRTHEEAGIAAARAAYLAGFAGTSNLEAGRRHGVPTLGTSAHAFTLLHDDEAQTFAGQIAALGRDTTLLVDTYDIEAGIRRAVEAGGPGLDAVRIDSGDLAKEAKEGRQVLDGAGMTRTRIVASGDLDEYRLTELQPAPIDAYGVGTSVVTGSGHATAGFVYKLVARSRSGDPAAPVEPVAKTIGVKATVGGRKRARRVLEHGTAVEERLTSWDDGDTPDPHEARPLQVPVLADGETLHRPSLGEIRDHHRRAIGELPPEALGVADGAPAIPTVRA
jgi:nicotinate phosphoribosyltransferase